MAGIASAAEVSQDAIDACIDGLRAEIGNVGGTVRSTEFSEANSLVMLEDSDGTVWRCLVSNDGRSAELERQQASAAPDAGGGGPAFFEVNVNTVLNVHDSPSTSARTVARLPSGQVVENRGCLESEGRTWCEIADGDASGWAAAEYLVAAAGRGEDAATADDGGGAMAGSGTGMVRVQFAPGSTGAELTGQLPPGESTRYVLAASAGQNLYFRLAPNGPGMFYQIFNPDGSFLLDQMTSEREYRGELWQSGDHVVEVINRGNGSTGFNVIFGVE
jgi:hypothetical protein